LSPKFGRFTFNADQPGPGHVERLAATPRGRYALARSLSAMREHIAAETDLVGIGSVISCRALSRCG